MHYKAARKPRPTIARELQVDAIVEGSVVRASDKVRITAKLIRGVTGEVIWTQSFERDLRDVLALHREVARTITREVGITLTNSRIYVGFHFRHAVTEGIKLGSKVGTVAFNHYLRPVQ